MKANILKIILFTSFLLVGIGINAQTQTLCTEELKTYTVDDGDSSGSGNYDWTLTENGTSTDLSGQITGDGENVVTIDWTDTTFDAYTLPAEFTLTVTETVNGCPGETQTLTISLIEGYLPPSITEFSPADICNLDADNDGNHDTEVFTLTGGTIGAVLTYEVTSDVNGVVVASTTVTLDATDTTANPTTIPVPALADPLVAETFTLTLQTVDDDNTDDCDAFTVPTPSMTDSDGNTIITQTSVTVNPIPTTTPIGTN